MMSPRVDSPELFLGFSGNGKWTELSAVKMLTFSLLDE
jgi:hypothetical protein